MVWVVDLVGHGCSMEQCILCLAGLSSSRALRISMAIDFSFCESHRAGKPPKMIYLRENILIMSSSSYRPAPCAREHRAPRKPAVSVAISRIVKSCSLRLTKPPGLIGINTSFRHRGEKYPANTQDLAQINMLPPPIHANPQHPHAHWYQARIILKDVAFDWRHYRQT